MQTGNLIYIFINVASLNFAKLPKYIFSLLAFLIGIFAQHFIVLKKNGDRVCYILIFSLYAVAVALSLTMENFILANALFSFGMAIQLQMTRSVSSFVIANTMCTGNMRSLMECFANYITTKDKKYLKGISIYASLICAFIIGIVTVTLIVNLCFGGI
jgi:uncharacterized membrane protein YoaK (UPF0700 family)